MTVIDFPGPTKLEIEPDKVLEAAVGELESVLILGTHKDGNEYFASSFSDAGAALWLMERCKTFLMLAADVRDDAG